MNEFSKRIISGLVYVVVFLAAILFSRETYISLITFFAGVCLWEFSKMIKTQNVLPYLLLVFFGFGILFNKIFYLQDYKIKLFLLVYTLVSSVMFIVYLFTTESKERASLANLFLAIKYIVLPFLFLMLLPFINGEYHPYIVIFTIVLIWVNDSFAYIVGKNLGKHKLFERISPKKTIEGFIGGLLFSVLVGILIGFYSSYFSVLHWVIIAILISVFGTIGDLVESKFKRQANVKDSGTIMPGHGGLLDRLDSLFFLAPFIYLYIHFIIN